MKLVVSREATKAECQFPSNPNHWPRSLMHPVSRCKTCVRPAPVLEVLSTAPSIQLPGQHSPINCPVSILIKKKEKAREDAKKNLPVCTKTHPMSRCNAVTSTLRPPESLSWRRIRRCDISCLYPVDLLLLLCLCGIRKYEVASSSRAGVFQPRVPSEGGHCPGWRSQRRLTSVAVQSVSDLVLSLDKRPWS